MGNGQNPTCPDAAIKWAIPARILNSLWCDFFPRLVAEAWLWTPPKPLTGIPPAPLVNAGMDAGKLVEVLERLEIEMSKVIAPAKPAPITVGDIPLAASATPGFSVVLYQRLQAILTFFSVHKNTLGPFPFSVSGTGGYDFLLSDWGVEFFMPDKPTSAADLFRYYSFRATGRASIGLPLYLESSSIIDSPTGPSQVKVSPNTLLQMVDAAHLQMVNAAHVIDPCWEEHFDAWRSCIEEKSSDDSYAVSGFKAYQCALAPFRCWQMEGSVYRGIMTEVPRIVASAWMEVQDGTHASPHAYHRRVYGSTRNKDKGFRELFRQRLETWIAEADKMFFGFDASPAPTVRVWDTKDLMITNRGLFFPEPRELPKDGPNQAKLKQLITEIAQGRAGNPVFTDSRRTQQ